MSDLRDQIIASEIVLHRQLRTMLGHRDEIGPELTGKGEETLAAIEAPLVSEGVDLATIDTPEVTTMVRNILGEETYDALTGEPR